MFRKKLPSILCATALSFCLSFGGVSAMVTGLSLNADLVALALGCLFGAAACAVGASFRWGGRIFLGVAALLILANLGVGSFKESWLSMIGSAFDYYDRAYGIGGAEMFDVSRQLNHTLPLLMISWLVTMVLCMTMLHRWPVALAVFLEILPLATCFVVIDTVPALWCILLWFFGLILLVMSHPVRQRNRRQGEKLAAILALPIAIGLGLLLLVAPQDGYQAPMALDSADDLVGWLSSKLPFVGQTYEGELVFNFGIGMTDRVDLGNLGKRTLPNTPVMELDADFYGKIYIRGIDMDQYDGRSWTASDDRVERDYYLPVNWTQKRGELNIRVLGSRGYKYVPTWPKYVTAFEGGQMANEGYSREYSFEVAQLPTNWKQRWRYSTSATTSVDSIYLELPSGTKERALRLLREAGVSTWEDTLTIAEDIDRYVSRSAAYDLDPDVMPKSKDDLAIWFLEEADKGYCVHFATSAVVLLRAAGVPARYVEGYTAYVSADKVTVVRADKAHAWVEYYVSGIGWMILDPTPSGSTTYPEDTEPGETVPGTTEPTQTTPTEESEITEPGETTETTEPTESTDETVPTESTGATEPTEITEATEPTDPAPTDPSESTSGDTSVETSSGASGPRQPPEEKPQARGWIIWLLVIVTGLLVLATVVVGQWLIRRRLRQKRLYRGNLNAQALARYRLVQRLARVRKVRIPGHLKQLAEKACFSRSGITAGELPRFDAFIQESKIALEKESWVKKLYYRLVLAII